MLRLPVQTPPVQTPPVQTRLVQTPLIQTLKILACASVIALVAALFTACASEPTPAPASGTEPPRATESVVEGHQPTPPPTQTQAAPASTAPPTPTQREGVSQSEPSGEVNDASAYSPAREGNELNVILATSVLEAGPQRVAFLLTTDTGLVKDSNVVITPVYVPDNTPGEAITTRFNEWPYGTRGTFAAQVDFDRPGPWRLDITAEGPDATGWGVQELTVMESSPVPALGSPGPLTENKTLSDFGDLSLITTDYSPDEALYHITIREAVESPLPAVVVFASPAFCTTATCGPQVDTVSELREAYADKAYFIHVEIYDNPDEIQGDLDRARIASAVDEWGLTQLPHWFNESWTFVLTADGRVLERFEGFATFTELEESLRAALN